MNLDAKVREALEFYAKEWCEVGFCVDSVMAPTKELERDKGSKARAAITALEQSDAEREPMLTADEEAELVDRINANPNLQPLPPERLSSHPGNEG